MLCFRVRRCSAFGCVTALLSGASLFCFRVLRALLLCFQLRRCSTFGCIFALHTDASLLCFQVRRRAAFRCIVALLSGASLFCFRVHRCPFGDPLRTPWRPLGGLLEASWRPLGGLLEASWRPLGGLLGALERPWVLLAFPKPIWDLLTSASERSQSAPEDQMGPQRSPKALPKGPQSV